MCEVCLNTIVTYAMCMLKKLMAAVTIPLTLRGCQLVTS